MAAEHPLLFNPVDENDEDPEDHLGVDLASGLLTYKKGSRRGEVSISIFGLNIRDQLVNDRKAALNDVKAQVAKLVAVEDSATAQAVMRDLANMREGAMSHTLARRAQLEEVRRRLAL